MRKCPPCQATEDSSGLERKATEGLLISGLLANRLIYLHVDGYDRAWRRHTLYGARACEESVDEYEKGTSSLSSRPVQAPT